jgi:hypothetical protein
MALDPKYVTDQTFDFPAAASTTNKSCSILLASRHDLVGIRWPVLVALSAKILLETTEDPLDTLDAAATWDPVEDKGGTATVLTAVYTVAGRKAFDPHDVILGPCRVRLAVFRTDGTTPVNQDEHVITPKFRPY